MVAITVNDPNNLKILYSTEPRTSRKQSNFNHIEKNTELN